MAADNERAPLVGSVHVEGGRRAPRAQNDEGRWSELRTDPNTWITSKPQLHEGRGGRPLVVLIPWAGAKPSQVADVVYFWQDQGCAVLRLAPSYWQLFKQSSAYDQEVEVYFQYLRTHVMPNRGFIVYAMSSLGSHVLARMMELDRKTDRGLFGFCKGVVFDSGPLVPTPQRVRDQGRLDVEWLSESAGVLTAAGKGEPLGPVVDLMWTPLYLLILILVGVFQYGQRVRRAEETFSRLTEGLKGIRVLLLYSEQDEYSDAFYVFEYKKAASQYTKVKAVMTETAHCAHLTEAPDITRPALREFLLRASEEE